MKKAVQFGAGNIGRGFIGALLSQSGYHVVFADVVDAIIDKINEDKTYTVHVMDVECEDQKIEDISGVNSTKPEAVDSTYPSTPVICPAKQIRSWPRTR